MPAPPVAVAASTAAAEDTNSGLGGYDRRSWIGAPGAALRVCSVAAAAAAAGGGGLGVAGGVVQCRAGMMIVEMRC